MKKIFIVIVSILSIFYLSGCTITDNSNNNKENNIIPDTDKIHIYSYVQNYVDPENCAIVELVEDINYIVNNVNSLTLVEYIGKPYDSDAYLITRRIEFYKEDELLVELEFISTNLIMINNQLYKITEGIFDIEYIDNLVDEYFNQETIYDKIVRLYQEEHDLTDVITIDIYKEYVKDNWPVVAFITNNYAYQVIGKEIIEDIVFYYSDSRRIEIYYNNQFYSLNSAYLTNIISYKDLLELNEIHNEKQNRICDGNKHLWDEGKESDSHTEILYTCEICGVTKTERIPSTGEYRIYTIGHTEYLVDNISGYYKGGEIITIKTIMLIDADIQILVNGNNVPLDVNNEDINFWYYTFEMPYEDVVLEIKVVTLKYYDLEGEYIGHRISSSDTSIDNKIFLTIKDNYLYLNDNMKQVGELYLFSEQQGNRFAEMFDNEDWISQFGDNSELINKISGENYNKYVKEHYSAVVCSIPESAPGYHIIVLEDEILYIYTLSTINYTFVDIYCIEKLVWIYT